MSAQRTATRGQSATTWVAELPSGWTNQTERLVLYVLALDAPSGVTASGRVILAQRTGLGFDQLKTTLHSLSVPTAVRPPLIERMPKCNSRDPDRYRLAPGTRRSSDGLLPLPGVGDDR